MNCPLSIDDPRKWREEFFIDDISQAYLDGNSLGRLPIAAEQRIASLVHQGWGKDLIGGWNRDWIDLPSRLGAKLATLLGCSPNEILVCDSTSLNLFKLAVAALSVRSQRTEVLSDAANFPSDHYILESAIEAAGGGRRMQVVGTADQIEIPSEQIVDSISSDTAVVSLSHVAFRSGHLYDIESISVAARNQGALTLWDLSHSVGAVPIDLHRSGVDMAVGCTYKYLCGGPGAPAFLYVREELQTQLKNPIRGWFSHAEPFAFKQQHRPASGIQKFAVGTPPVISMCAIEAGLDLILKIGIGRLRSRSIELTQLLLNQIEPHLDRLGYSLRSPPHSSRRGSHISLGHVEARRITENLIQRHNVIPDFRTPDNIRLGIAPLYTSEEEIASTVNGLVDSVEKGEYRSIEIGKGRVT